MNKGIKPKIGINIGATFDIPSSAIVTGSKGETIFNGGLGQITGIVGTGNNFKSTIMHYMMFAGANTINATKETGCSLYDTEVNISPERLEELSSNFKYLPEDVIFGENPFVFVTDKTQYAGDEWMNELKGILREKVKNKSNLTEFTGLINKNTKKPTQDYVPSFIEIDSLSEFESAVTMDMIDKSKKDDSSNNTLFMKQGLYKTKMISELPLMANMGNNFFLVTAHVGEAGPVMDKYNQPTKKLQHMKSADKLKGVSPKFFFLTTQAYMAHTASLLKNQTTKLAEFPKSKEDIMETDLNVVKLTMLRNKTGASGFTLDIVVSQTDGVLPTLTEFLNIKNRDRYGITGNNISYQIAIYPDVNLSRTTVRRKIDEDPKLRRAINIVSEMCQLEKFQNNYLTRNDLKITPEELYVKIKEQGYDWDVLLDTRGWMAIDNYSKDLPEYLNTIDLLKMAKGEYRPYWYDKKIKEIGLVDGK